MDCDMDGDGISNPLLDDDVDGDGLLDGQDPDPMEAAIAVPALEISGIFVFAYPGTLRQKWVGLILGIPALYCFNLFRLVFLFQTGAAHPVLFQYVHVYLGQIRMILVALTIALIWIGYSIKGGTTDIPAGFFSIYSVLHYTFFGVDSLLPGICPVPLLYYKPVDGIV
jgi:exosortase/archaeosortase family protein